MGRLFRRQRRWLRQNPEHASVVFAGLVAVTLGLVAAVALTTLK